MAAIDGTRADRYQWLPEILGRKEHGGQEKDKQGKGGQEKGKQGNGEQENGRQWSALFPQQNHCIATPTRPYDCQEITFMDRKIYIG